MLSQCQLSINLDFVHVGANFLVLLSEESDDGNGCVLIMHHVDLPSLAAAKIPDSQLHLLVD